MEQNEPDQIDQMPEDELREKLHTAIIRIRDLQYEVNQLEFEKARYLRWYKKACEAQKQ